MSENYKIKRKTQPTRGGHPKIRERVKIPASEGLGSPHRIPIYVSGISSPGGAGGGGMGDSR